VDYILYSSAATFSSVQKVFRGRKCKTLHLCFASLVMLRDHTSTHKQYQLIANAENVESAEWQEDHKDLTEQTIPE